MARRSIGSLTSQVAFPQFWYFHRIVVIRLGAYSTRGVDSGSTLVFLPWFKEYGTGSQCRLSGIIVLPVFGPLRGVISSPLFSTRWGIPFYPKVLFKFFRGLFIQKTRFLTYPSWPYWKSLSSNIGLSHVTQNPC